MAIFDRKKQKGLAVRAPPYQESCSPRGRARRLDWARKAALRMREGVRL